MAEERRITIRGKQRRQIDPGLIAQILVALGKRLSEQHEADLPVERSVG